MFSNGAIVGVEDSLQLVELRDEGFQALLRLCLVGCGGL